MKEERRHHLEGLDRNESLEARQSPPPTRILGAVVVMGTA